MSRSTDLFIEAPVSLGDFVAELRASLGTPLEYRSDASQTWYETKSRDAIFQVSEHSLVGTPTLRLQDYKFILSFYPGTRNISSEEEWIDWRNRVVYPVFNR